MSKCLKMHIVHSGFTGRDITNFLRIKKLGKTDQENIKLLNMDHYFWQINNQVWIVLTFSEYMARGVVGLITTMAAPA